MTDATDDLPIVKIGGREFKIAEPPLALNRRLSPRIIRGGSVNWFAIRDEDYDELCDIILVGINIAHFKSISKLNVIEYTDGALTREEWDKLPVKTKELSAALKVIATACGLDPPKEGAGTGNSPPADSTGTASSPK